MKLSSKLFTRPLFQTSSKPHTHGQPGLLTTFSPTLLPTLLPTFLAIFALVAGIGVGGCHTSWEEEDDSYYGHDEDDGYSLVGGYRTIDGVQSPALVSADHGAIPRRRQRVYWRARRRTMYRR